VEGTGGEEGEERERENLVAMWARDTLGLT
jgi:hypothetical protein